jgi:hypothetical protein
MPHENLKAQNEGDDARKIPEKFPDRQTCRVRRSTLLDDYFECCNVWRAHCSYCVTFGEQHFCRHPAAALIFEWSN